MNVPTLLTTCSRYKLKMSAKWKPPGSETCTAGYFDQKIVSSVNDFKCVSAICCGSQRTMRRTERRTPARADLYATSSPRPSWDWGPWELREWLTHHRQTHSPVPCANSQNNCSIVSVRQTLEQNLNQCVRACNNNVIMREQTGGCNISGALLSVFSN